MRSVCTVDARCTIMVVIGGMLCQLFVEDFRFRILALLVIIRVCAVTYLFSQYQLLQEESQ